MTDVLSTFEVCQVVQREADGLTSWKSVGIKLAGGPAAVRNAPIVIQLTKACDVTFEPRFLF